MKILEYVFSMCIRESGRDDRTRGNFYLRIIFSQVPLFQKCDYLSGSSYNFQFKSA